MASGAFFFTDAMPFFIDALLEYISLLPIICLLAAVRTKYGSPFLDVFCSKRVSFVQLVQTDLIPFFAAALVLYVWLVRIICPLAALRLNMNFPLWPFFNSNFPGMIAPFLRGFR